MTWRAFGYGAIGFNVGCAVFDAVTGAFTLAAVAMTLAVTCVGVQAVADYYRTKRGTAETERRMAAMALAEMERAVAAGTVRVEAAVERAVRH